MKKSRWTDPNVPIPILALKLTEEVGEVANEIVKLEWLILQDNVSAGDTAELRADAIAELSHVEFIAKTLRERLRRDTRV